jgi:hypothetical protein
LGGRKKLTLITELCSAYMEPLFYVSRGKIGEGDTGKPDYRNLGVAPKRRAAVVLPHLDKKIPQSVIGFDHGVGHPLLLLYDAKTPRGQKTKEFNGLGDDPFNVSISLF